MASKFPQEFLNELNRLMDRYDVVIRQISARDKLNDLFYLNLQGEETKYFFVNDENEFVVEVDDSLKLAEQKNNRWSIRKTKFLWGFANLLNKYNITLTQENIREI
jgi:hypothetical protein